VYIRIVNKKIDNIIILIDNRASLIEYILYKILVEYTYYIRGVSAYFNKT